ncbi:hypothetical protein BBK36DRAFT_1179956, partial [Trichoderma citrinoviride]
APEAEFHPSFDEDGRGRMECLPQTRVQLLDDICDWLDDFESSQKHLYWLQGKAGTGKSTIARTVVSRMTQRKRIVANFFFKRGEGDRARLKRFFTTLSAQLVRKLPGFATIVQDALESEPSLPEQDPGVQFKKLVQEPLQKQKFGSHKAIVVVVDALDECDSKGDLETLVEQLSQSMVRTQGDKTSPGQLLVKYFVTSRLDHRTQSGFNRLPEEAYEKTELERATSDTIKQDIECYLRIHLQNIDGLLERLPNSSPWSNPANVEILRKLTDRASPLFEFAAAACRFIGQTEIPGQPRDLLQDILESSNYGDLDGVYLPIMNRRFFGLNNKNRITAKKQFQKVIGSVLCLADSITIPCLAKLLDQPEAAVRKELSHFRSVLVVPEEQDSSTPISLFHESFRDFTLGPDANEEFKPDSAKVHTFLTTQCIKLLRGALRENICKLKSPGTYRSEVAEETIQMSLSQEIQYACRFWIYHLMKCGLHPIGGDDWHTFLSSHLLHWVEALSWLERTSEIVSMSTDGAEMRAFLDDADRFILYFSQIIDTAPLQLYSSALTFSPTNSVIRKTFDTCRHKWIIRTPIVDPTWSSCLQTLEGHDGEPICVAFSAQGILASGNSAGTVNIWDPKSGVCLQTLCEDDIGPMVLSIAFSKCGKLACRTIRSTSLWDMSQQNCFQKLDCTLSLDEDVSSFRGAYSSTVAFQDEQTLLFTVGGLVKVFESDLTYDLPEYFRYNGRRQLVLSSNGERAACVGQGGISVFDMRCKDRPPSGVKMDLSKNFDTRNPRWACFSRDNKYLAASYYGYSIRIWDVASAACLQTLDGGTRIESATFSPDGRWIATGGLQGNILIWEWKGGTRLSALTGHISSVSSLAFTQDGAWLASASRDGTVKIWDLSIEADKEEMPRHRPLMRSIAIAMDGRRFVTSDAFASEYKLWDDYGKKCVTVPFPTDNRSIICAEGNISGAFNHAHLELQDVETGRSLPTPLHDYKHINSIALSANGERLVIASEDGRIGLWESRTGKLLKEMRRREDLSRWFPVVISADGDQHHISHDGEWIMRHSEKLLWLPPDYRPVGAAASGSNIAILRGCGNPYLIGLSDDGLLTE